MSTLYDEEQTLTPGAATSRLRVVLLLDLLDGHEEKFLDAYEQIRRQVADVRGHIRDQLCQSIGDASQWLVTSEWEGTEPFLRWMGSDEHRALVQPMESCVRKATSLRFRIARETPETMPASAAGAASSAGTAGAAGSASSASDGAAAASRGAARARSAVAARSATAVTAAAAAASAGRAAAPARPAASTRARAGKRQRVARTDPSPSPAQAPGPVSRGALRHALTFTIKPGGEGTVEGLLAGYRSPAARVDGNTRLCRTSLFMHGNRVVLALDVEGDLGDALRHVVAQPEVRAVEEAIGPYLEDRRDLADPSSARAFFARAAMPAVQRVGAADTGLGGAARYAFLYPVRPERGAAAARLLAEQDAAAAADPADLLAGSTMFLRDGVLVRMVDLRGSYQDAVERAAGFGPGRAAQRLSRHLDVDAGTDLRTRPGIERFLARCCMNPVTDRQAKDA